MNDFVQLKPVSNVYEAETMVEGQGFAKSLCKGAYLNIFLHSNLMQMIFSVFSSIELYKQVHQMASHLIQRMSLKSQLKETHAKLIKMRAMKKKIKARPTGKPQRNQYVSCTLDIQMVKKFVFLQFLMYTSTLKSGYRVLGGKKAKMLERNHSHRRK